jgi:hypothetical protein
VGESLIEALNGDKMNESEVRRLIRKQTDILKEESEIIREQNRRLVDLISRVKNDGIPVARADDARKD